MGTFDPANPQQPHMPAPYQEPFSPIQAIIGVITNPVPTLRQIAENRPWVMALLVYIGVALISGLSQMLAPGQQIDPAMFNELGPEERQVAEAIAANATGGFALVGVIVGPIFLAIGAGVLYLIGRLFGGRGEYSSLFSVLGFASVPTVISAVLSIPVHFGGVALAPVAGLLSFITSLWVLVLYIIGVRESMSLSTGRAIGTCAVPCVVIFLLACIAGIALFSLIVAAVSSSTN